MSGHGGHQSHMWLMGGLIAILLLLRVGAGLVAVLAVALILCGVMVGSILWLIRRPPNRRATFGSGHDRIRRP